MIERWAEIVAAAIAGPLLLGVVFGAGVIGYAVIDAFCLLFLGCRTH